MRIFTKWLSWYNLRYKKTKENNMSDSTDQLATLQANNTADAAALTALENDLNTPATDSTGDQVLAAVVPVVTNAGLVEVFGADALSSALTADGYTVTPPAPVDSTDDLNASEITTDTPS